MKEVIFEIAGKAFSRNDIFLILVQYRRFLSLFSCLKYLSIILFFYPFRIDCKQRIYGRGLIVKFV